MDLLYKIFVDPFVQMGTSPDLLVQTLWDGLVAGVLYSLIALGFVLIFKASGVFNFAQGIMVVFAALTLVGLHQHGTPPPPEAFSEFRIGLDHVAFGCPDRAELEKWMRRLDELDIVHGGIKDAAYGSGLSFRDPDGIALELFAPPA